MSDDFYRAFEERHRGSRELIKGRLAAYLPFIEPLSDTYPSASAVDLGCGRGEWLELIAESGLRPVGVDLDKGMLDACIERGLPVEQGDALAYLSALPDESQVLVSAFHVVEHISFEQLGVLIAEALRVLKPGALLIMETPNPENIVVATQNFYLDPTHQKPIPPMLLSFMAEYQGFARVKLLRLQEPKHLRSSTSLTLLDVLGGASPDYAVVAQKKAVSEIFGKMDLAFELDYGLSMASLAISYQNQMDAKAQQAESKAQRAETAARHWQSQAAEWHEHILAIHSSTSWRVTKPIRAIKRLLSSDFVAFERSTAAAKLKVKQTFRPVVSSGLAYVFNRPALRKLLSPCLKFFPSLHRRLRYVAENAGLIPNGISPQSASAGFFAQLELHTMTPRARQIYQDLKAAIVNKNEGAA